MFAGLSVGALSLGFQRARESEVIPSCVSMVVTRPRRAMVTV